MNRFSDFQGRKYSVLKLLYKLQNLINKGTYSLHSKPISEVSQYDLLTNTELRVAEPVLFFRLRYVYTGDFCCDLSPFDACD